MNVLVFDIETVPDVESGRRLFELRDLSDEHVAEVMYQRRRQAAGNDFLSHDLHRIVAIAGVVRSGNRFKVGSFGTEESSEQELIQRFYDGIGHPTQPPVLVSWNGGGFDLPVLHYRALIHGVAAPRYWDAGYFERDFRWNNYLNRFHERHTDLMDVLSGYQMRAAASLNEIATLLGFPGKLGMDGSKVWATYQQGDIKAIRDYCETDVLNTYLVYLRYQLIRGHLSHEDYGKECQRARDELAAQDKLHFRAFLDAWAS